MEYKNYQNNGLEFRQIVLGQLKQILNLSLRSNKDKQKLDFYFNSIEALADVLIPFYDEQIEKFLVLFESQLGLLEMENKQEIKKLCPNEYSESYNPIYLLKKEKLYRELFKRLNLLLKRNNYLKDEIFGDNFNEENEEEVVEEDDSLKNKEDI